MSWFKALSDKTLMSGFIQHKIKQMESNVIHEAANSLTANLSRNRCPRINTNNHIETDANCNTPYTRFWLASICSFLHLICII